MLDASEQELLVETLPKLSRMKSILRFDLSDGAGLTIDARTDKPIVVEDGSLDPDCTIKTSRENMIKLIRGEMDAILAYTLGRIKVQGSLDIAMKLVKAIGS